MNLTSNSNQIIRGINHRMSVGLLVVMLAILVGFPTPLRAELTIEVTKGVEVAIPIAIVPFTGASNGKGIADIINANLARSGKFEPLARKQFIDIPSDVASVQYKNWRLLKVEALVLGQVTAVDGGKYEVVFHLLDVFRGQQLVAQKFVVSGTQMRLVAHLISNAIYKQLLGINGAFNTRVAYIGVTGPFSKKRYLLRVADADGHNPKTILKSSQPIFSPTWSPKGDKMAYVSFEKNRSIIYVQDIRSGKRQQVAAHQGINGAPAWSPNGKRLAMTLSLDGNSEIYVYALGSGKLRRITRHPGIDTEPTWSPNGSTLAFTSSRAGTPQIYRVSASGGKPKRVTFQGKYNAAANYSGDGKHIALITNQGNGYRVGVYSVAKRFVRELTQTSQDESPTFSPNDEMIMYATQTGGRGVLAVVSLDTQVRQIIRLPSGSVREPAWAPFDQQL